VDRKSIKILIIIGIVCFVILAGIIGIVAYRRHNVKQIEAELMQNQTFDTSMTIDDIKKMVRSGGLSSDIDTVAKLLNEIFLHRIKENNLDLLSTEIEELMPIAQDLVDAQTEIALEQADEKMLGTIAHIIEMMTYYNGAISDENKTKLHSIVTRMASLSGDATVTSADVDVIVNTLVGAVQQLNEFAKMKNQLPSMPAMESPGSEMAEEMPEGA